MRALLINVDTVRHRRGDVAGKSRSVPLPHAIWMKRGLESLGEQGLFAAEIALDEGYIGSRFRGDVSQGRAVVAGVREVGFGRFEDGGASGFGVAFARRGALAAQHCNVVHTPLISLRPPIILWRGAE